MQNHQIWNFHVTDLLYIFSEDLRNGLKLQKMVKTVKFEEDPAELGPKICLFRQSEQNIWNQIKKFSKFGQTKKV